MIKNEKNSSKNELADFFFLFFDIAGNRAMFRFKRQGWCLNTTEAVLDSFPFSGTKTNYI